VHLACPDLPADREVQMGRDNLGCPRPRWKAVPEPECREQRVLDDLLGSVEVAQHAGHRRRQPPRLFSDGGQRVGRGYGRVTTGRISTVARPGATSISA
jgi:hypothetical protein